MYHIYHNDLLSRHYVNYTASFFFINIEILFFKDKRHILFKYVISKDFEFAKLGSQKLIVNTNTDSIGIQFAKESGLPKSNTNQPIWAFFLSNEYFYVLKRKK